MKKKFISIAVIAVIVAVIVGYIMLSPKQHSDNQVAMDTFISMNIIGQNPKEKGQEIMEMIHQFETDNSMYREDSAVSKINNQAGLSSVPVPKKTYDMLRRAYDLSEQSGGKFDITIAPVVLEWDITGDNPHVPEIKQETLDLVNYRDIEFGEQDSSVMLKKPGQKLDIGGLAKGQVCDEVKSILAADGSTKSAIVSVGGNVLIYGDTAYNVGIKHPRKTDSMIATVKLQNRTISTTGDYERFFELDGKRYHHIFDKTTGQPYDSDFYSVTVIGEDGMLGDYLSTYLFMSDKETVVSLLDKYEIIAFGKDNKIYCSSGLELEIKDASFTRFN